MLKDDRGERVKALKEITARNTFREIEGCTSWRHNAVHQDRSWLLNAIAKIRMQVEKIQQAENNPGAETSVEVKELLQMFEEETLNHIGDD